jgi:hypothetical protein
MWGYGVPPRCWQAGHRLLAGPGQAVGLINSLHEPERSRQASVRKSDGTLFPVEPANLMADETGKPSYLLGFFIGSPRKKAEDALRKRKK